MKPNDTKNHLIPIIFLLLISILTLCGCPSSGGPELPVESIDNTLPEKLQSSLKGLYQKDKDDVLLAIRELGAMHEKAEAAVPYLITMIDDKRLATSWTKGYGRPAPLCKEAGIALGLIGEKGIHALSDILKDTGQSPGIYDDLMRESVAEGFKAAISHWGDTPFKSLYGSDRVNYIIQAADVCLNLHPNPGKMDKYDPRNSLKYYKHFSDVSTREGLKVYIEVLGLIGDERALPLLCGITPLSKYTKAPETTGPFKKTALVAQYKITPLAVDSITPPYADILLIKFTATGDLKRVKALLDDGLNPDIITRLGHPVIGIAWKQEHPDIFNALIDAGATVDLRLSKNDTLLIRSARSGDDTLVKALLLNSADPSLVNNAKETALVACLTELFTFWNDKATDKEAKPYFKTIKHLINAGSPPAPDKLLKSIDKKARKILNL